jgi:hypothetical protein
MNPYRQQFLDSIDRAAGSMMAEMPIAYQLEYRHICSTTSKFYNRCWHASRGVEKRVMKCWLCAGDPSKPCQLLPRFDDNDELCPYCRTAEAGKAGKASGEEESHRREMVEGRERNARRREERERERRASMMGRKTREAGGSK